MTKKQRRRVWGSVTEMRRGKKYVLRWMQNTPQGRKRKTKTVYGTYREACAELDRIHVEHADDAPVPTIAKAYETWLVPKMAAQVEAGTLAPNTRDLVLRSWKNYVGPRWGAMPVDQLRAVELQGWLLTLPAATADTALLTLLSKLVEKGYLSVERQGRHNLYRPLVSEADYRRWANRSFLGKMYQSSLRRMVASLVESRDLTDRDLAELEEFIAGQRRAREEERS